MNPKPPKSDFRSILAQLAHRSGLRPAFDAFVRLSACALSAQTREPEYLEEAKRWERSELELVSTAHGALVAEMESRPFVDVLGEYFMEFALFSKAQQWNGEFHTPKPICDLMARMTLGDLGALPAQGPITVCEPACGSGAMILGFAQACPPEIRRRLRVTTVNINLVACDMAFINTSLWGIPARIIHGNSLSMEFWAAWSNIHHIAPRLPYVLRNQTP